MYFFLLILSGSLWVAAVLLNKAKSEVKQTTSEQSFVLFKVFDPEPHWLYLGLAEDV